MWEFTLCLTLAVVMAMPVGAHESEPDWPTPRQLSQVQPAIRGSLPIAQKLVDRWAYRLDAEQATLLRDVRTQLQFMQRLEAGTLGAEQQLTDEERRRLVDYFRWKTEQALFRFLECLTEPNVIFLNLTEDVQDWWGIDQGRERIGQAAGDILSAQFIRGETGSPEHPRSLRGRGEWVHH